MRIGREHCTSSPPTYRHRGVRDQARWCEQNAMGRYAHTYAALDLGTNNCRLLIARPHKRSFRVIDAFSRIVRLGEGVGKSGRLSDDAMDRTVDALKICAEKMARRGVTRVRSVATQACRIANNREAFLQRVKAETGLSFNTISSGEEAKLAAAGCRPLMDPDAEHVLVFDIGGGSTELTWLQPKRRHRKFVAWASIPRGVVNLAECYGADCDSAPAYQDMVREVVALVREFEDKHALAETVAAGRLQLLGTSGTVTTLAGVHLGLQRYERRRVDGQWLTFAETDRITQQLRLMSLTDRARHPCIGQERADLVLPGCAVLDAILETWPTGRFRVADRGVREGLLMSMMRREDRRMQRRTAEQQASAQ